jgi:pimeloyl-ACP methyl ester carboxylesterase
MPVTLIDNVQIQYRVVGEAGPWLALTTGGRRGHDEFLSLAAKIASHGFRVLLWDRRNTGASDVLIEGEDGEEVIWTNDLHRLLAEQNALPAFIGGSSSGSRLAMLFALRYPQDTSGLLLFRVTGGAFAAGRLPESYYGLYIKAAREGGMAAVCATEQYQERIAANPRTRDRLMAMDPAKYIAVMSHWYDLFAAGLGHPVAGVSAAELGSITVPTIIIPGNDKTHSSLSGQTAHEMIPGSLLHRLPVEDQDVPVVSFEDWAEYEDEIAAVFAGFMHRVGSRGAEK